MAVTFATKHEPQHAQHETEPTESVEMPEVVTATPRYLQQSFSAAAAPDDPPVSPLLRSQVALQTKLTLNAPGDAYEQEADRVAQQVMRSSQPRVQHGPQQVQRRSTEDEEEEPADGLVQASTIPRYLQGEGYRASDSRANREAPASVNATINRSGQPLDSSTRAFMETRFGQDFSGVQVHTNSQAVQSAADIGAEAYTVGQNIAFGEGRYAPSTTQGDTLIAHELTHVVQQSGHSAAMLLGDVAVQQFSEEQLVHLSWITDQLWSLAPEWLENLIHDIQAAGGVLAYIENLISGIVDNVFGGLQAGANTVVELVEAFATLYTTIPVLSVAIISGNREMFTEAVVNLTDALKTIVGHAWDALETLLGPVRSFLTGVVETLNQPLETWIMDVAGGIWEAILAIGNQLSDAVNWVFDNVPFAQEAWDEVRDLIGIDFAGRDFSGWISELAAEAWATVQSGLSSVMTGIQETAETILEVISVENIKSLREIVDGWITTVSDMLIALNSDDGNGIATAQDLLRVLMPLIQAGAAVLRDLIISAGTWVAGLIGRLAEKVRGLINLFASNSLIGAVIPELFAWVVEAVDALANWAQNIVMGLFIAVGDTITFLAQFIEPVLITLINLAATTTDLVGALPNLIQGVWNAIPEWIREPIENFVLNEVLARIPIFGELITNPEVWAMVQEAAMQILQQIFVTGDLVGAAWTFFQVLLELLHFPTELVVQIIDKAAAVFTQIFEDPVGFLLNLLEAVKQGFVQFFNNILNHLFQGVVDWLFGQATEAGINPPTDLSLGSILQFVLDILGLSMDMIWERLALKIGEERVEQIKTAINVLTGAWEWISVAINDGPGALWEMIQSQISGLWTTIINAAMQWIMMKVIEKATIWLLGFLDPTFIMAVVNSLIILYKAIESFIEYITEMLEIINTVLDGIGEIAAGAIGGAANYLENGLAESLPIAIGFLANQFGLGKLGKKLAEIIGTVREYVVKGIDWLIDKALAAAGAVFEFGKAAVGKVVEWWNQEEEFEDSEGKEHHIYFERKGDDYQLMIASNPRAARAFIDAVKFPDDMEPDAKAELERKRGEARDLAEQLENTTTSTETVASELDRLATLTGQLFAQAEGGKDTYGTKAKPYRIKWHKKFSAKYPDIELAPEPGKPKETYKIGGRKEIKLEDRQLEERLRTEETTLEQQIEGLQERQAEAPVPITDPATLNANAASNLSAVNTARTDWTALMGEYPSLIGPYSKPVINPTLLAGGEARYVARFNKIIDNLNLLTSKTETEIYDIVYYYRTLGNNLSSHIETLAKEINPDAAAINKRASAEAMNAALNQIGASLPGFSTWIDKMSAAGKVLKDNQALDRTVTAPILLQQEQEKQGFAQIKQDDLDMAIENWEGVKSNITPGPPKLLTVTLGVMPQYMVSAGMILGPSRTGTRGGRGQERFREYVERAGHNMSKASPSQDAEHVTDLWFGGDDIIENLWPYAGKNPIANQLIYRELGADTESLNPTEEKEASDNKYVPHEMGSANWSEFANKYFIVTGESANA